MRMYSSVSGALLAWLYLNILGHDQIFVVWPWARWPHLPAWEILGSVRGQNRYISSDSNIVIVVTPWIQAAERQGVFLGWPSWTCLPGRCWKRSTRPWISPWWWGIPVTICRLLGREQQLSHQQCLTTASELQWKLPASPGSTSYEDCVLTMGNKKQRTLKLQ